LKTVGLLVAFMLTQRKWILFDLCRTHLHSSWLLYVFQLRLN